MRFCVKVRASAKARLPAGYLNRSVCYEEIIDFE